MSKEKNIGNQTEPENPTTDDGKQVSLAEKINSVKSEEEFNEISKELMSGDLTMEDDYEPQEEEKEVNEETEEDEETQQLQEQEEEPQEEIEEQEGNDEDVEEVEEDETERETIEEITIPFHGEEKKINITKNGVKIPTKFLGNITEDTYEWNELINELQLAKKQRRDRTIIDKRRKSVQKLEKNNITDRDLELLTQLKNGSKEVIESFIKEYDIDPYDLDIEQAKSLDDYNIKEEKDVVSYDVKSVMEKAVQQDGQKQFDDNIQKIKEIKSYLPDNVFAKSAENAEHFAILYNQVREGNLNKILPKLIRQLDNPQLSAKIRENPDIFWKYYEDIGKKMGVLNYAQQQSAKPADDTEVGTTTSKPFNEKKQKAGQKIKGKKKTRSGKKTKLSDYSPEEIKNMSYEQFLEFEKNIRK